MKFLNKKEQVMDFKLTSYGHYLLSAGKFKPQFYAFYDDNVLYDGKYAFITESSNQIHDRIKNKTQYLESQVLFDEVETESTIIQGDVGTFYELDINPISIEPRKDVFKYEHAIGDAYLDGDRNLAPAWKVVALNGKILTSSLSDNVNDFKIPQIDITLNYFKKTVKKNFIGRYSTGSVSRALSTSNEFTDGTTLQLFSEDLVLYVEELNTELLFENFDIEVYEVLTGSGNRRCITSDTCVNQDKFRKKYFNEQNYSLKGAAITEDYFTKNKAFDRLGVVRSVSSSVQYYFDVLTDESIDNKMACKASEIFNKESLYIDLDFDCENLDSTIRKFTMDIYGPVTEPEIC